MDQNIIDSLTAALGTGYVGSDNMGVDSSHNTRGVSPASQTFGSFIGGAFHSAVGLAGDAIHAVTNIPHDFVQGAHTLSNYTSQMTTDPANQNSYNSQIASLKQLEDHATMMLRQNGNRAQYNARMKNISSGYSDLYKQVATDKASHISTGQAAKASVPIIGDLLTAASLGTAAPEVAGAEGLIGAATDTGLGQVIKAGVKKFLTPDLAPTYGIGSVKTLAKNVALAPARNLLVDQTNVNSAMDAAHAVKDHHYMDATKDVAGAGLLAAAPKVLGAVGKEAKNLIFSNHGDILNHIKTADGTLADHYKAAQAIVDAGGKGAKAAQLVVNRGKVLAQHFMDEHGSIPKAVAAMKDTFGDTTLMTSKDLAKNADKYISAHNSLSKELPGAHFVPDGTDANGQTIMRPLTADEAATRRTLTRVSQGDVKSISGQFDPNGSPADWQATLDHLKTSGAFKQLPDSVLNQVTSIVRDAKSHTELTSAIDKINTTTPIYEKIPGLDAEATKVAETRDRVLNAPSDVKPTSAETQKMIDEAFKPEVKAASNNLPANLAGAKPTYNYGSKAFTLKFGNDASKALYVVGGKGQSASHEAYMQFLRETTGKSDAEIQKMAQELRDGVKSQAKVLPGGEISVTHPGTVKPNSISAPVPTEIPKEAPAPAEVPKEAPATKPGEAPAGYRLAYRGDYQVGLASHDITPFVKSDEATPLNYASKAIFGAIGDKIRQAGLTPEGDVKGAMSYALKQTFVPNIEAADPAFAGKGEALLRALKTQAGNIDARLMTKDEVAKAMTSVGLSPDLIKHVQPALDKAYTDIGLELRGVGNKITDNVIAKVPGMRQYLRFQNAARFGKYNPFFQAKRLVKGEFVAQSYGASATSGQAAKAVEEVARRGGVSNFDFTGGGAGPIGQGYTDKSLTRKAQRLTQGLMNRAGVTNAADVAKDPQLKAAIEHGVQSIYGYPHDSFLNSNLAKTLNLAVFPLRFDAKIASAGAHFLADKSPAVRVGLVTSLMHANDYLSSPEGQKWAQKNSQLVKSIQYFTPATTIGHILDLGKGKVANAKDLGEIGGLPFGVITNMLEHQGVDLGKFGSSNSIDISTGKPYGKTVPTSDKARAQVFVQDFLTSLFSFPGTSLGLTAKSKLINDFVPGLKVAADEKKTIGDNTTTTSKSLIPQKLTTGKELATPVAAARIPKTARTAKAPRAKASKTVPRNLQL